MQNLILNHIGLLDHPAISKHSYLKWNFQVLATNNFKTRLNPMQNVILNHIGILDHPAISKHSYLKLNFQVLAGKQLFHIILSTNNFRMRLNPMQNLILNHIGLLYHPAISKHSYLKWNFQVLARKQLFHIILPTNSFRIRLNPTQNLILNHIGLLYHPAISKHSYLKWNFQVLGGKQLFHIILPTNNSQQFLYQMQNLIV